MTKLTITDCADNKLEFSMYDGCVYVLASVHLSWDKVELTPDDIAQLIGFLKGALSAAD